MFGRSKPKAFKPYALGASRPRRRVPRWLIWLFLGMVIGAGGLLYVQQELMPQRLSVQASEQLTRQASELGTSLAQTRTELEQARQSLAAQQAKSDDLAGRLSLAQAELAPLQEDLALLQQVLPADPRGGDLQIRAGRFFNESGKLAYHLVLTREDVASPFKGTVQFAVEGRYPNGRSATVELDPIQLDLDDYRNFQGQVALPDGMHASQITTRVLNGDGRLQAMRIINSRS